MGDFISTMRNAFVDAYNPRFRAEERQNQQMKDFANQYAQFIARPEIQAIRNKPEFFQQYTDMANASGNPYAMMEVANPFMKDQQHFAFNPQANPMLTADLKEYAMITGDTNIENKQAAASWLAQANSSRGTHVTVSPTMQMADPNFDNIPLSKDLWDKVEWVDQANNGKIMTNGDARLGRIKMKGTVTEDARGKANVYGVLLETGGRELDPLYQPGGRLSKEVRRRVRDNSALTDPVARQAWTDQILIDQPFQLLKDKYLSPEGKQLEQGSNLITEPVLRISTGAAAPDTEQTRFKMMLAPKVSDTDQVLLTKRVAQKMLGTVIKGQAMGFHVDPINTDDVYLGEVKTVKGNQMIFAYDIKHNRIYAAMTDGSKHILTDEEKQQFLSGD